MVDDEKVVEHGIQTAIYSNLPEFHPVLECLCGWTTGRSCYNWETAGADLDEHLEFWAEMKDKVKPRLSQTEGWLKVIKDGGKKKRSDHGTK